jgi:hypothetical protein
MSFVQPIVVVSTGCTGKVFLCVQLDQLCSDMKIRFGYRQEAYRLG